MVKTIGQVQPHSSQEEVIYKSLLNLHKYEEFKPISIYVQTSQDTTQRVVKTFLGSGGSKRAYELENGAALLMNGASFANSRSPKWSNMIDEEIMATKRVKELGLLAGNLEKANVFMTGDSTIGIPAYLTESFSQLSLKGMWIIDQKNPSSSIWKERFFSDNTTDSFNEKKWEKLLNPFLKDVAKLLANNFWLYSDNVNMAVLKKFDEGDDLKYEIRYFGFDFSSKEGSLSFKTLDLKTIHSLVPSIVGDAVSSLMHCEFGYVHSEKRDALRKNLVKRCKEIIVTEIQSQREVSIITRIWAAVKEFFTKMKEVLIALKGKAFAGVSQIREWISRGFTKARTT